MTALRASRRRWLAAGAGAYGGLGWAAGSKAAQFEFKCGSNHPLDFPATIRLTQMWQAVERESGGRVRTQFYPNSQLGGEAAMLTQLRVGALQFFFPTPGILASVVPAANVSYVGFAFRDADDALRVMDGPLGAYVRQEAAAKGLHVLRSIWDAGMTQIGSTTRPIVVPDDLHGFKIRVVESSITVDLFKGLGAGVTTLAFAEIYPALQTRIIDGEAAPLLNIQTGKFYEINRYVSLTNHAWAGNWLVANGDTWKSLPPDLQEIVERNNTKFALLERKDTKAQSAALVAQLVREGLAVNAVDPAPFQARLTSYYQAWANEFGAAEWNLLESAIKRKLS